jgi:hypothetical protein
MDCDDPRALQAEAAHYFASAYTSVAYPADSAFAAAAEAWSNISIGLAMTLKNKEAHATEVSVLAGLARDVLGNPFRPVPAVDAAWLKREAGAIHMLATGIYEQRAFRRLPLLADALEDAGCTDADLLGHLRGPGPHVRGCWAVDLVLGKS